MTNSKPSLAEQLRGATKLIVDATRNVTDAVEKMHHTIGGSVAKLVSAPAYGAVRGVTGVVGAALDIALAKLQPLLDQTGADRGAVLAALNGVLGDHLAATHNALAIQPVLVHDTPLGKRLVIAVHGSSSDEGCWQRNGKDHPAAFAAARGASVIAFRYNSGLHVSENGRIFATLLEELVTKNEVDELTIIAHSMGGLVSRSACVVGETEHHVWRTKLRALATLGTPHHGAPLERGGNWFQALLGVSRFSSPLEPLAHVRSAGVTDLRFGSVVEADWAGKDRFSLEGDSRVPLPLPAGVACFAIAATLSAAGTDASSLRSDGLVPVDSAFGIHADAARTLVFPKKAMISAANHLDLLDSAEVLEHLLAWSY